MAVGGEALAKLFVFDDSDNLVCIASNKKGGLHFWDADFSENLNQPSLLVFSCLPDHENSKFIETKNQVAFKDKDGFFRLFRIEAVEKRIDIQGEYLKVRCKDAILELAKDVIEDIRPRDVTLDTALRRALSGQSRWEVGEVAPLGINSTSFFYISALEAVGRCLDVWRAELRVRIETDGRRITRRLVEAIRRGRDTGLQMRVGHNVDGLNLTVDTSHIRTLMYGRGAGIPNQDESGNATGGYSRKIMFGDVVATEATHGFNKPAGQRFVADDQAKELFGLVNPRTGEREHLEDIYDNSQISDPNDLMMATWEYLQSNNRPQYYVEVTLALLAELLGEEFNHERLSLGDVVRLIDTETFTSTIRIEIRVIGIKYDLTRPEEAKVELGDFRNLYAKDDLLGDIVQGLNEGRWSMQAVVGPGNVANIRPQRVTGLVAQGGYSQINLRWDSQGITVANFELHGSEIEDFEPSDINLIYRGSVSTFDHRVEPNRQWYYRCRAINHQGVVGEWSEQVHAQTENTRRVEELEALIGEMEGQIEGLEEQVEALEEKIDFLQEQIDRLMEEVGIPYDRNIQR